MFDELNNKLAVVTGSSGGIGGQICKTLSKVGVKVIGVDCVEKENDSIKAFFNTDLGDEESIKDSFSSIKDQYGSPDILINSAGISRPMKFMDISRELWDKMLNINLTSQYLCIRETIEEMAAKGYGKIVNISSRSGVKGSKGFAAYSASKFGCIGLTQAVANEYAPFHVNVNAVCPGIVYTPMWEKQIDDYIALKGYCPDDMQNELTKKIPMGRLQTEVDIANTVLFLISDLSKNITGETIMVTGGY